MTHPTRIARSCRLAARALAAPWLLAAALAAGAARADDTALFSTTAVAPNVLLLLDNSGSMNQIMTHPAYSPSLSVSCSYYSNGSRYTFSSDSTLTRCGNTRTLYHDPGTNGGTRYSGHYLNWLFSDAADPYQSDIESGTNGVPAPCLGGSPYGKYRRARITTAKQVLKEVLCQVNLVSQVRFGLAIFREDGSDNDPNGAYVVEPIELADAAQVADLVNAIDSVDADSYTPLAESLFQAYTYFMSRTTSNRPFGKDGSTRFPLYAYSTSSSGTGGPFITSGYLPDPVEYACQKNFVIIVTDGEPTKDDFDVSNPSDTAQGFSSFVNNLIGDYNPDGEVESQPNLVCSGCETALYLDDVALFMQTNDFRPDLPGEQTIDVYTIGFGTLAVANALLQKTADVGNGTFTRSEDQEQLSTAIVSALSDIIEKTQSFTAATVPASRTAEGDHLYVSLFTPSDRTPWWSGHLRSYRLNPAGEIRDANDACAVDDPSGACFSGPFLPVAERPPFWDAGEELERANPDGRKLYTSVLRGASPAPKRVDFEHEAPVAGVPPANAVAAADLGVTFPPATTPLGSTAVDVEEYADEIVANVRGCQFGSGAHGIPCLPRTAVLGDIFHSSPVVVGQPAVFDPDPSYRIGFVGRVRDRERVAYAGSNGGFLHGFHAGDWRTDLTPNRYDPGSGAERFGFMPWPARQSIQHKPFDTGSRDYYYVDGAASVTDAWLYADWQTAAKDPSGDEWRTLLVGGLRQGGEAYYALDVSLPGAGSCMPPASGSGYPCYLWEFPREDDGPAYQDYVGQTWGEPILTKLRVRSGPDVFERWVAIVSGGYHPSGDPNDHAAYDPAATEGRSLWVLDLKTGRPLASRTFDTAGDCSDPTSPLNTSPERAMCFAIAATPAVYDADRDGYADVIYAGDLGGNVWKWVIRAPLELSGATSAVDAAADWPFRKLFAAPVYEPSPGVTFHKSFFFPPAATLRNGKLWLAFGSGERQDLLFMGDPATEDDNNRFYALQDLDPFDRLSPPLATLAEGDLVNLTSDASCADIGAARGYYVIGQEGEKWVTNVDIFGYQVIASSYVPAPSSDPCEIGGQAFLWVFKIHCGEGFFADASGNPSRSVDIGGGLPSDPRVTIGASGGTSNRVIVSKQGGDVVNLEAPPGFGAGIGMFYWRELQQ
jgi:type IV pilus assembly protein PilY1